MDFYPKAAMERAMKVQEVILRAMAKKITWWQAAEIIGISDRHMRRWRERYEEERLQRVARPAAGPAVAPRVPVATVEQVFGLYRDKYFDLNVQHFHEKLQARARDRTELHLGEAGAAGSGAGGAGTQARGASQAASAAAVAGDAVAHRRQPAPWFQDERWYDLIVILDDATSEIYYAQLVEEESTATVMAGLQEVIERKGVFCALYSDRGSHFWLTPKVGGKVDYHR